MIFRILQPKIEKISNVVEEPQIVRQSKSSVFSTHFNVLIIVNNTSWLFISLKRSEHDP